MANVIIDDSIALTDLNSGERKVVFTDQDTGYLFYVETATEDLMYRKTTDGGNTWSSSVYIDTTTNSITMNAVYFCKWGGSDRNSIYIVASIYIGYHALRIYELDASDDTLTINDTVGTAWSEYPSYFFNKVSISMNSSNNVFICFVPYPDPADYLYSTMYMSDANGENFSRITTSELGYISYSTTVLFTIVQHPTSVDNMLFIAFDISNNKIKYKEYNKATATWDALWTDVATGPDIDAYVSRGCRISSVLYSNNVYIAIASDNGTSKGFKCFKFDGSLWSELADIEWETTTSWDAKSVSLSVDSNTGHIYAIYVKGDSTAPDNDAYYKKSEDLGLTWSDAAQLNDSTTRIDNISSSIGVGNSRIVAAWTDYSNSDYIYESVEVTTKRTWAGRDQLSPDMEWVLDEDLPPEDAVIEGETLDPADEIATGGTGGGGVYGWGGGGRGVGNGGGAGGGGAAGWDRTERVPSGHWVLNPDWIPRTPIEE